MRNLLTSLMILLIMSVLRPQGEEMPVPEPEGPAPLSVIFAVHLELEEDEESMLGFPVDIFQRVAEEASLTDFHVHDVKRGYRSRIRFAFPTMEAFNAWYASGSTEILLRALEDSATDMKVKLAASREGMPPPMHKKMKPYGAEPHE